MSFICKRDPEVAGTYAFEQATCYAERACDRLDCMSETGTAVSRPRRSHAEAEQLAVEFEESGLPRRWLCAAHFDAATLERLLTALAGS